MGDEQTKKPHVEGTFSVIEKSTLIKVASRVAMGVGALILALAVAKVFPPGILGVHLLVLGGLAARSQNVYNFFGRKEQRNVRITEEGVLLDGVLMVPRATIADGLYQPRPAKNPNKKRSYGSTVRLFDKKKRIVFEQEVDEPKALEILNVLGLDATKRRAVFSASSPLYATTLRNLAFTWGTMAGCVALGLLIAFLGAKQLGGLTALLMFPIMFGGMIPSKIEVGVDGIVQKWLWQKKFIPMSQIQRVSFGAATDLKLELVGGKIETLYMSMGRRVNAYALQKRDATYARINEALAVYRGGGKAADVAALVSRGSQTGNEWLESLKKLRDAAAGYRAAVVRDEDLWSLVENPTAPADARAGAALALRNALDADGKARVRIAAEATASPKLRAALDAVAKESDEDATAALEELAREELEREEAEREALAAAKG